MNTVWNKATKFIRSNIFLYIGLTIALITRVYFSTLSSLWYDEAYSGLTIKLPFSEMVNSIVNDVHPPLYYILLKIWTILFGENQFSIRQFSVLIGFALVIIAYLYLKDKIQDKLKLNLLMVFFALMPMFVGYSVEVRSYSLLALITVAYAYLYEYNSKTGKLSLLLGLLAALMFLTHYVAIVIIAAFFVNQIIKDKPSLKQLPKYVITYIKKNIILFITFLIWLPVLANQFLRTGGSLGWVPDLSISSFPLILGNIFTGVEHNSLGYPPSLLGNNTSLIIGTILITCIFLFFKIKNNTLIRVSVISYFLVTIIYIVGPNMLIDRYLLPITTLLLLGVFIEISKLKNFYLIFLSVIFISLSGLITLSTKYNYNNLDYIYSQECFFNDGINFVIYKYYEYPNYEVKLCTDKPRDFIGWTMINEEDLSVLPPNQD